MPSAGQIYRFRSVGNASFGPQTNYFKATEPSLLNAVSFVVTNTIYTTTKSGHIGQYSQGNVLPFETTGLPDVTNISQIAYRTTPEMLVLFDSKRQSFIFLRVQAGSASFIKELVVNNTTDISSFSLDEKNNLLYFVSSDGLYSIPLP